MDLINAASVPDTTAFAAAASTESGDVLRYTRLRQSQRSTRCRSQVPAQQLPRNRGIQSTPGKGLRGEAQH